MMRLGEVLRRTHRRRVLSGGIVGGAALEGAAALIGGWQASSPRRSRIQGFVAGKSGTTYAGEILLRSAVERQFEIAGEAMSVLRGLDPEAAGRVPNVHRIVGMQNILIHGYAQVNDLTV